MRPRHTRTSILSQGTFIFQILHFHIVAGYIYLTQPTPYTPLKVFLPYCRRVTKLANIAQTDIMPEDYSVDGTSFFIGPNDWAFIQGVNREFIDEVVNTSVVLYQVVPEETYADIYGDAPDGKVYTVPLSIEVLITPQDQQTARQTGGPEKKQTLQFAVQREVLKEFDIYPKEGDIVQWSNNLYYEIKTTVDNNLLSSKPHYRHGVTVTAESTRISKINIIDPNQ